MSTPNSTSICKYIVDISGKLPTILCELDPSDSSLTDSYIYAPFIPMHIGTQPLAHHAHGTGGAIDNTYWYVHDRLGSVRQVFEYTAADIAGRNTLTYAPFGETLENFKAASATEKPFKFTGQYHDEEINQYYLRARQYDPKMMRFTTRDPARGTLEEPVTLHKYLYCINSPTIYVDLNGEEFSLPSLAINTGIGAAIGGTSAYVSTGGDWSATGLGILTGAASGASGSLFNKVGASVAGMLLSSFQSGYNAHVTGENVYAHAAIGAGVGALSAGVGEIIDLIVDFDDAIFGLISYGGGVAFSELYGRLAGGAFGVGEDKVDSYSERLEDDMQGF